MKIKRFFRWLNLIHKAFKNLIDNFFWILKRNDCNKISKILYNFKSCTFKLFAFIFILNCIIGKSWFQVVLAEVVTGLYVASRSTDKKPRRHGKYKEGMYSMFSNYLTYNSDIDPNNPNSKFIRCDTMSNSDPGDGWVMNIIDNNSQAYPNYVIVYEVST